MYPGQHVGILPDGCVKAPGQTGTGGHARYIPTVIRYVSPLLTVYEIAVKWHTCACACLYCQSVKIAGNFHYFYLLKPASIP